MKSYLNCKKISTAILRAKKILINRVCKNGLYENFGRDEIRDIKDKFIDTSDYSKEMNLNRTKLEIFSEWCSAYSLKNIKQN